MPLRAGLESDFFRRRPLFWMALSFCAGICLDASAALPPNVLLSILLAGFVAAILAAFFFARTVFMAGLLSACVLGAAVHAARFRIHSKDDVASRTPERPCFAWVRGTIVEAEWRTDHGAPLRSPAQRTAWTVAVDALGQKADALLPASGKIRITSKVEARADEVASAAEKTLAAGASNALIATLAEGDRVQFRALLEPPPVSTIPDSFDYGSYLAGLGIQRVGTLAPATLTKCGGPEWWRIALRLRRFSGELAARTPMLLNGHDEQAGLLNAMVFGRREALSASDREAFAISGTAHLLAISGLHIQLLCLFLWRIMGLFGLSRRKSAVWVFVVCLGYCLLTGSSPPAVRATVMFGAYVAASFFQRATDPLSALAAAALIVLSHAPHELFSAGFQLSFLAVLALHALLPAFDEAWERWRARRAGTPILAMDAPVSVVETLKKWAGQSILVTLAAWLATAPPVAWHMGRFSTLGLFVNLFALPMLSVCMALGSATIALGYFWPALGKLFGTGAWMSLWVLEKINAFCAALPGSSIDMPRPAVWTLCAYAGLLIWLWIARRENAEPRRLAWIIPLCPLLLLSNLLFRSAPATPELTVLDLSHGRAALIETRNGAALVDAGAAGQGLRVAELLRRRGIRRIDLLILTADEPDTAGGALELLSRVAVRRAVLPRCKFPSEMRRAIEAQLFEKNVPYGSPSAAEEVIGPGGVRWEFLDDGPSAGLPAANASALSARASCGAFQALFVAAKSSASLARLLAKPSGDFFKADVLRLTPGEHSRWPRETAEIIRRSQSRMLIAGTFVNPEETPGMDFEALTESVLSPHREGSIRVRAGTGGRLEFHAFRGEWREVK